MAELKKVFTLKIDGIETSIKSLADLRGAIKTVDSILKQGGLGKDVAKNLSSELVNLKTRLLELNGITDEFTLGDLEAVLKRLRAEVRLIPRDTLEGKKAYAEAEEQLKSLSLAVLEMNRNLRGSKSLQAAPAA